MHRFASNNIEVVWLTSIYIACSVYESILGEYGAVVQCIKPAILTHLKLLLTEEFTSIVSLEDLAFI